MLATWLALTLLGTASIGCGTKPAPRPTDGRPCWLAILSDEQAGYFFLHYSIPARAGDLLITRACVDQELEDATNEVRRLTR